MSKKEERIKARELARGIDPNAPKGVAFFSVKSGDTHYAKSEAQIQAYINSSDRGINASRGQDKGWRLGQEWVKAIRAFKEDESKMDTLAAKLRLEDGVMPTDIQILYAIYGRQIRTYMQRKKNDENPHEEQYLSDISSQPQPAQETAAPAVQPEVKPMPEKGIPIDADQDKPTDRAEGVAAPSQEESATSTGNRAPESPEAPSVPTENQTER